MTITIKEENIDYRRIVKSYVLEINGKEVNVTKWWVDDEMSGEYENDYEINEEDRQKLTEDEEDELLDFITDLE